MQIQKLITFFVVLMACMAFLSKNVFAQKIISLESERGYKVGKSLVYFEDVQNNISLSDILADSSRKNIKWQNFSSDNLNFGLSLSTFWVKISLKNSASHNDWLLVMSYPVLDTMEIYQKTNNVWKKEFHSDRQSFELRNFKHHNYITELYLPDHQPHDIYLRVNTGGSVSVPIDIVEHQKFTENVALEEIGYGLYYGIMLCMVFYNLFIFLSLRDISYIYYILSIISTTIFLGNVTGHSFQYVAPHAILFQNSGATLGMFAWVATSARFSISFLKSERYTPILTKILSLNVIIGFIGSFINFFAPYSVMVRVGIVIVGFNAIIILITAIRNNLKGNKVARYFTLAWAFFLACVFTIVLTRGGILPTNFFTAHGVEIGSAVEVILLSFALSDRYKLLKLANDKLQQEALKAQKQANETLEGKVKERTFKLQEIVEELNQTNEELQSSVDLIQEQKRIIEKKNTDITASIQYAKRIQTAMMPLEKNMQKWLPEHFVFLKPRDIVSGDFYWATEKDGKIFLSAADCTGHGVPGALMSMIGSNILHDIITVKNIVNSDLILARLRKGITNTLQQDTTNNRDGMDIAFCVIDKTQRNIEFSGANNGLFYVKTNNEISETHFIKADKMSIGGMQTDAEIRPFSKHIIALENTETATFYMYSDGYQDQFGGERGRKLMAKGFHELLNAVHILPMKEQKQAMQKHLTLWLNSHDQIDDILVIGFKI